MILKKIAINFFIIIVIIFINSSCKKNEIQTINNKIQNLINAYPDFLKDYKYNNIIWNDGSMMNYNDYIENKNFNESMNNPDLEDQMKLEYPDENYLALIKIENNDPGRIRYEPFFLKMYGENKKEVEKKLVKIKWMPRSTKKEI
jgi:peptidoglycan L-alanyl-D-glutamate endopeptidase CwlK